MLGYVQYVVDLLFVYKYGRQRCLDYYNTFENIDRVIGMPYYNEIKRSVTKICFFFILIGSVYFISDYTALVLLYGWFISAVHSIDYIYTVIKILSALDGIAHFIQVKFRLKRIGDVLQDYYNSVASLPGMRKDVISKTDSTTTVCLSNRWKLELLDTIGYSRTKTILRLSKCYLLLLEQCDYVNGMFGFRVPFHKSNLFTILLSTAMKVVNYSSILLCGIHCCERTYKQTDRILRCIDHLMANKIISPESHEALKELRELVISRPVRFNAVHFYTLDYATMLAMASAIVTYTIILLQNMQ
ncbi:uncharacterized protein LOC112050478 [Bicyclus anynana]|uniref:Gustatory receptor n=1 Tax=Bicyclus anynana TaxID=110368 RepID=A0ABM3LXZ2_BICAN|nr:uncharacterized protein LOC112050478 [Bicyclus anynana]